jgi:hypothetical protein
MGAYDSPQMIQTRADQLAKNITTFYKAATGTADKLREVQEAKVEKAKKELKEAEQKEAATFGSIDEAIAKVENDSKDFLGLTNEKEQSDLQNQIRRNLEVIRNNMDKDITSEMSLRQINAVKAKYVAQVSTFKSDLDNLTAAYQEWNDAKGLKPNQEGAIVASYNPEMISVFKAFDDDKYNIRISPRDDGGFEISELDFNKPENGSYAVSNSFNLTDWKNKSLKDGYFQNSTKLDLAPAEKDFEKLIKDGTLGNKMTRTKTGTDSKGKPLTGTEDYYVFDKSKFDNWKLTDAGKQYANSLVDSKNAEGYWQALGNMEKIKTKVQKIDPTTGLPLVAGSGVAINQLPQSFFEDKEIETWKPYKGQDFSPENLQGAIFDLMENKFSQASNIQ